MTDTAPLGVPGARMAGDERVAAPRPHVRKFRQIVLWPVQLMPRHEGAAIQRHWEALSPLDHASAWKEVADEFTADPKQFSERHYKEFVTFLPYVQRFLYGAGGVHEQLTGFGESSVRVFRRKDVAQARVAFPNEAQPTVFEVVHADLYFFHDIDVAILAMEIAAEDLCLATALNAMYRFGRAYPTHWEASGRGGHCAERVEWLGRDGSVLAALGLRRARHVPRVRGRAPRPLRGVALALPARAAGVAPLGRARPPPLPGDRVPADAGDGLARVR